MFAVALLLALGLDLDVPVVRVALCLMLAALIGTQSHWVLLALACGAFFVPLGRWRRAGWPLAMGLVAGVVVLASAPPTSARGPPGSPRRSCGRVGAPPRREPRPLGPRVGAAVVLVILVAGGTAIAAVHPPGVTAPAEPVDQGRPWRGRPRLGPGDPPS